MVTAEIKCGLKGAGNTNLNNTATSVILTTYNRAPLVPRAVESVLRQTFTDFELIIIVDGSTDDTMQRLEPYQNRARIIYQPNAGLGAARNHGLELARARYVAFVDDDDAWHPDKLRLQMEFFASRTECSMVITAAASAEKPTQPLDNVLVCRDAARIVNRPLKLKSVGKILIVPSTIMFDRQLAPNASFYAVKGCLEDITFLVEVLACGKLGVAGDKPLVFMGIGSSNSLGTSAQSWILGRTHMRKLASQNKLGPAAGPYAADVRAFLGYLGRTTAVVAMRQGKTAAAMDAYTREFWHQLRLGRVKFLAGFPLVMIKRQMPRLWRREKPV